VGGGTTQLRITAAHRATLVGGDEELEFAAMPGVTVPVHYDDYGRFRSPPLDFLARAPNLPGEIRTVRRGETVAVAPEE
jgi:hypothetical protein